MRLGVMLDYTGRTIELPKKAKANDADAISPNLP